jgi:hypothetical protein
MQTPKLKGRQDKRDFSVDREVTVTNSRPTLDVALDTDRGRFMPKTMRLAASRYVRGETPNQIASAMGIRVSLVRQYLGEVVRYLHCQPLSLNIPDRVEEERGSNVRPEALTGDQLMIEARCRACGRLIEENEGRALAAAMMLECHRDEDDGLDYAIVPKVGAALHYCDECTDKIEEFRIANPWFVPEEDRKVAADRTAQALARAEREATDQSKALSVALAAGDTSSFNSAMPTTADREDVMGHAMPMSRVASRLADADDDHWDKMAAAHASGSAEAVQREKLRGYLKSPGSRGMRPNMRQAADVSGRRQPGPNRP